MFKSFFSPLIFTLIILPNLIFGQTRYTDDLFEKVAVSTHLYSVKEGDSLMLDLYQAEGDSLSEKPLLIWVHGGGFYEGTRDNPKEVRLMKAFARKGYIAASISYRLLKKGTEEKFGCDCPAEDKIMIFREAARDLLDAGDFLLEKQKELGINPKRIILGGSSAGAETVLSAAFMKDFLFPERSSLPKIEFSAVISLAGALADVRYLTGENAVPTVMFHGTDDDLVPYGTAPHHYCNPEEAGYLWLDGSKTIAEKLTELQESFLLYTVRGEKHDIAQIPFEQLDLIFGFLKDVVIDRKYKVVRLEK
ncbi:MAG: alpha/beta hydrolase [Bacteroidia bacterium]|nr:alpha/beta hydrolase [Bacteroidia bacterium]